jgi:O-antigen/teichoic acid export membrane protein
VHNERRILLNTTVLGAAQGLGQLANLILVVSFARAFGAAALGHYSVAMAASGVAALFVGLGTHGLLLREISRNPECAGGWIGVLLPAQSMLAFVAWLAACVVSIALIGESGAIALVMSVCAYQILLRPATILLAPFQARELMIVAAGTDLAHRLITLLLGLCAIGLGASAGTVGLAMVAGAASLIALAWFQTSRRFGRPELRFAPSEALRLFRLGAPFFGIAALTVIYARSPALLLSGLTTAEAVGLYAAADRLIFAAGLGPAMFDAAAYPALVRIASTSLADARALCARCLRLLAIGAVPLAALIAIFSVELVRLLFGASYSGGAAALQVLAWSLPIRGAQALLGSQLSAMDQQAGLARVRLVGLCAFGVFCPVLILWLGYVGAAWAVLLGDSIHLTLCWMMLQKSGGAPSLTKAFVAPGIAAATTLAASALLSGLGAGQRLIAVSIVLGAGMWIFGAVRLHDLRFLRALIFGAESLPRA